MNAFCNHEYKVFGEHEAPEGTKYKTEICQLCGDKKLLHFSPIPEGWSEYDPEKETYTKVKDE